MEWTSLCCWFSILYLFNQKNYWNRFTFFFFFFFQQQKYANRLDFSSGLIHVAIFDIFKITVVLLYRFMEIIVMAVQIIPGVLSMWMVPLSQIAGISRGGHASILIRYNLVLLPTFCIKVAWVSPLQNNCIWGERHVATEMKWNTERREEKDFSFINFCPYFRVNMAGYNLYECVTKLWQRLQRSGSAGNIPQER